MASGPRSGSTWKATLGLGLLTVCGVAVVLVLAARAGLLEPSERPTTAPAWQLPEPERTAATTDEAQQAEQTPPSGQTPPSDETPPSDTAEPGTVAAISDLPDEQWVERATAATGISPRALRAYAGADLYAREHHDCAVGWNTLAGIGWVESRHGGIGESSLDDDGVARPPIIGIPLDGTRGTAEVPDTDGGVLDGDARWDRAVGPMQFIPETWARWGVDGSGDGEADVHQIDDAALSAAVYLCSVGGSLTDDAAWIAAVRTYNNSVEYQHEVAGVATRYATAVHDATDPATTTPEAGTTPTPD